MTVTITNIIQKIKFNYTIKETYEAGIILHKWEIKSIKKNGFNIAGSYVVVNNLVCTLINSDIYDTNNKLGKRNRQLLLTKKEILHLKNMLSIKRWTLIPTKIFWKKKFIKIQLTLCTGKKKYDKRYILKEKETEKTMKKYL